MVAGDLPKEVAVPGTDSFRLKSRKGRSAPALVKPKSSATTFRRVSKDVASKNLFCRYELKYRISESKATAIEQFVKPYIHLDRYAKLQPDGSYPIVSLYLDSEDFKLCRESLTGKKNRFKLRIRSYSDDPGTPYFVEIKRRMNNIIIKSRARVTTNDNVATLLSGRPLPPQKYKADEQTLRQFQLYMQCINAKPAIRIRYMRKAYEDDSDNRVRVTFDRQLCYNVGNGPAIMFNSMSWQWHRRSDVILELKFSARYPAWLSRMVKCFDLRTQSLSKYSISVKESCLRGFCAPQLSV